MEFSRHKPLFEVARRRDRGVEGQGVKESGDSRFTACVFWYLVVALHRRYPCIRLRACPVCMCCACDVEERSKFGALILDCHSGLATSICIRVAT